jgi:hypothetical protein
MWLNKLRTCDLYFLTKERRKTSATYAVVGVTTVKRTKWVNFCGGLIFLKIGYLFLRWFFRPGKRFLANILFKMFFYS